MQGNEDKGRSATPSADVAASQERVLEVHVLDEVVADVRRLAEANGGTTTRPGG